MADSLLAIISDIKAFFLSGIQTLPLTMAGTLLVLGFGTANYAMMVFLLGYLIVIPLIVMILNLGESGDMPPGCGIVLGLGGTYRVSLWVAMVYFFLGYMGTNAYMMYIQDPSDSGDTQKTALRKSQCVMGMIAVVLCMVVFGVIRGMGGCENPFVMGATALVFAAVGGSWYYLFNVGSLQGGRMSDLFGIANRLLAPSAFVNETVGCIPMA